MKNKISSFLLGVSALGMICSTPIMAQEQFPSGDDEYIVVQEENRDVPIVPEEDLTVVPENGLGSIQVQLEETSYFLSRDGVKLGIVKIADVEDGSYVMQEPYTEAGIEINEIDTANELTEAAWTFKDIVDEQEWTEEEIDFVESDENGIATFTDLEVGVYMIYALDIAEYEVIAPFIIAIPTWDDATKTMLYEIEVSPKHSHLPIVEVNKVDSVTGKNITNNQFKFTSYSDKECKEQLETVTADTEEGTAEFTMTYGTMYIRETAAPQGYRLSDEVVKVEFTEDGLFVNDKEIQPEEEYIYSIRYQNVMLPTVKTGVDDQTLFYIGVAIIGAATALIAVTFVKKKSNK